MNCLPLGSVWEWDASRGALNLVIFSLLKRDIGDQITHGNRIGVRRKNSVLEYCNNLFFTVRMVRLGNPPACKRTRYYPLFIIVITVITHHHAPPLQLVRLQHRFCLPRRCMLALKSRALELPQCPQIASNAGDVGEGVREGEKKTPPSAECAF